LRSSGGWRSVSGAIEGDDCDDGPIRAEASGVLRVPNSIIAVAITSPIMRIAHYATGFLSESPANDDGC